MNIKPTAVNSVLFVIIM